MFFVFLRRAPSYYSNGMLISLGGGICVTDCIRGVLLAPLMPSVPDMSGQRCFKKRREA